VEVKDLQTAAEYQSERRQVFPSQGAHTWFMRVHRAELEAAGALVVVNRRLLIVPDRFDNVVLTLGARQASAPHPSLDDSGEVDA
jgi:hypothetical protein